MTVHANAVVMLLSEEVTFSADGNIFSGNGDIQAFEFDFLEKIKVFTIGGLRNVFSVNSPNLSRQPFR